jgi:hypothetical protein
MWIIRTHKIGSPHSASYRKVRNRYAAEIERGVLPTHREMEEWIERKMDRTHDATFSVQVTPELVDAMTVQDSMEAYYEEMTKGKEVQCVGTRTRKRIKCVICMNCKFTKIKLQCGHIFHRKCIDEWARWKPNCPVCNADLELVQETL